MSDERIKLTREELALLVLSTIAEPSETVDQGAGAKRIAMEMMEATGVPTAEANRLMQEWLDAPQPSGQVADIEGPLVKAMTVGITS